jgi:hypothetical protein
MTEAERQFEVRRRMWRIIFALACMFALLGLCLVTKRYEGSMLITHADITGSQYMAMALTAYLLWQTYHLMKHITL